MKRRRAAAPYAKVLFALAKERAQTELVGRELGEAAATFEGVAELRDFFARPWIPAPAKRTVAKEIAQPLTDAERRELPAKLGKAWGAGRWCSRRSSTARFIRGLEDAQCR